jgi:response regulator of citrate/malate metabolism
MPINKPTIRILIIDDDEDDYFITSEYLRQIEEYNLVIHWSYKFSAMPSSTPSSVQL